MMTEQPLEPAVPYATPLLTVEQVAQHLGLQPSTISEYISNGRLRAVKLGISNRAGIRIRADDLQVFIDSLKPTNAWPAT